MNDSKRISMAYFIVCAIAILSILISGIYVFYLETQIKNGNLFYIEIKSVDSPNVEIKAIELDNFVPGDTYEHKITVSNKTKFQTECVLELFEGQYKELTPFLEFKILVDGDTVYDGEFSTVFESENKLCNVDAFDTVNISVIYKMKETAENEAMAKKTTFDLQITCQSITNN